jgi:hypothetical protein
VGKNFFIKKHTPSVLWANRYGIDSMYAGHISYQLSFALQFSQNFALGESGEPHSLQNLLRVLGGASYSWSGICAVPGGVRAVVDGICAVPGGVCAVVGGVYNGIFLKGRHGKLQIQRVFVRVYNMGVCHHVTVRGHDESA